MSRPKLPSGPAVFANPEQVPPAGASAIPLPRGWVAWVDDEDYAALAQHRWTLEVHGDGTTVYAVRQEWNGGAPIGHKMHRAILGLDGPTPFIDHREHRHEIRVVDNRKENLRTCVRAENARHRRLTKRATSSVFKGVIATRDGHWLARIMRDHKSVSLGTFTDEGHAALAYDLAAVKLHGDFALTNFPVPGSQHWHFGEVAEAS